MSRFHQLPDRFPSLFPVTVPSLLVLEKKVGGVGVLIRHKKKEKKERGGAAKKKRKAEVRRFRTNICTNRLAPIPTPSHTHTYSTTHSSEIRVRDKSHTHSRKRAFKAKEELCHGGRLEWIRCEGFHLHSPKFFTETIYFCFATPKAENTKRTPRSCKDVFTLHNSSSRCEIRVYSFIYGLSHTLCNSRIQNDPLRSPNVNSHLGFRTDSSSPGDAPETTMASWLKDAPEREREESHPARPCLLFIVWKQI
ncbi:hypothetical protein CDAR_620851 [Caerostris darwini]|uniref:Uncharacterized protein n=1 Tax=Caerostris darwini TaxID=1538125 RepID=A0AAV4URX3_9ARAC|nr:hypothetical protein CDAR_620851 [Caerostris darwini]